MTIQKSHGLRKNVSLIRVTSVVALFTAVALVSSASGVSAKSYSRSNGTKLTFMTPPAKGPISNFVWDLPSGEPTTLDYVKVGVASGNIVVANLCDTLQRINPNLTYGPNLATSYKYSANHLTLTYTLRHDVKFWDGTSLTSADVAYSLQRNMNPADSPVNGYVYPNVKSITATGRYTVVVKFTKPDEMFNDEMAGAPGVIAEKAYIEKKGNAYGTPSGGIMCSGPFKLQGWTSGSQMVLAANTSYWNKNLIPHAKTVTLKFITDTGTLTQALKSGAIDGAYQLAASAIPALEGQGAGKLYFGVSPQLNLLLPNDTPAGNDQKIRKALSMVLDRAALAAKIFNGGAQPAYSILPKPLWDSRALSTYQKINNELNLPTSPNPAAAKALIKNDPLAKDPITINALAGDQTQIDTVTLWQQEAKSIGLNIQIAIQQPLQWNNAFYVSTARKGIDFVYDPTYTYVPNPLDYLTDNVYQGGALTYIHSPAGTKVTNLLAKARATLDATQRAELIGQALKLATAAQLVIPMATEDLSTYMNKRITGAIATWGFFAYPSLALIGRS